MAAFNFEKNLPHQTQAVESTLSVFTDLVVQFPSTLERQFANPVIKQTEPLGQFRQNMRRLYEESGISQQINTSKNVIDIMMETGTGKTYTYAKTIFELNKRFGIFKFVVVVPTLSIKAGAISFLKSDSCRQHFKEQYGKTLKLYVVESQKSKSKKSGFAPSVKDFVHAGQYEQNSIQVMLINAGMINSDSLQKHYDTGLFDKFHVPLAAIAATNPFLIVDEPHKFGQENKTWENIQKMNPQFILRYGATFKSYDNLVYELSAVDSFNQNLVKGVMGHITEFADGKNALVKFVDSDGHEATLQVTEHKVVKTVRLSKKDSLEKVHSQMTDLWVENLNKSTLILSNGLEMKKGESVNPYIYAQTLQEIMMQKAIKHHFELERDFLKRQVKIKPITLFFIDNIEAYRKQDGYLRKHLEQMVKAEISQMLRTEEDGFYRTYLEKSLLDISKTHGGYFSKDNSEKDEAIEKEINEILHDKQALLDLENPRRFVFSKWTLREGWDNPNVFQICKIRSSGSDISKLQEVGRGLRLPVNEYGNRIKDEQFYLNYFVDFTEADFITQLASEINKKSNVSAFSIEAPPEKLTEEMIKAICTTYEMEEDALFEVLDANEVVKRNNDFRENGFNYIQENYPNIFKSGVDGNKIQVAGKQKQKIRIRAEKYAALKELWEKLNEKVMLSYKFKDEAHFKDLLISYLKSAKATLSADNGVTNKTHTIAIEKGIATIAEEQSIYSVSAPFYAMRYSDFLKELGKVLHINIKTLHEALVASEIDFNLYMNLSSIRLLKSGFEYYLIENAIDKFSIEYQRITNNIHPTKFTDPKGAVLSEVLASDIGVMHSDKSVAQSYFLDEFYYDSELEMKNIETQLAQVTVFTKIPKNSIKIPIPGGKSYSPDFAYVLDFKNGEKQLHLIVETKNAQEIDLRGEEKFKIEFAKEFFKGAINIEFRSQFSHNTIRELIEEIVLKQ